MPKKTLIIVAAIFACFLPGCVYKAPCITHNNARHLPNMTRALMERGDL